MYEGYIDPLFVEIGDFTMTSLNICIFSHLIYHDGVFIKKVKIGKACVVLEEINDVQNTGRVRMGKEEWRAESNSGNDITAGTKVVVVSISGTRLIVEPVAKGE